MFGIGIAVLLSYWFQHLSVRYRFPAVVLLLLAGVLARALTHSYHNTVILPEQLIPLLGTAGLVLIVLEGALDLRLDSRRQTFLLRTFGAAAFGLAGTTLLLTLLLSAMFGLPHLLACLVAAPFGVISSAVAIPSAAALQRGDREFVIYESSWSDIFGVMLFNALLAAYYGHGVTSSVLGGSLAVLVVGALIALGFYWLVGHLEGHVKFAPLLFALILVYAGADALHLSPLLIVLILGLVLNNRQLLKRFPLLNGLHSDHFDRELDRLKHLTAEATFLVRTFFFLLLGYATDPRTFSDPLAWLIAAAIVAIIFGARALTLFFLNARRVFPLLWMAPRGLITATLFFSIPAEVAPDGFPKGAFVLVVLISCLVMSIGLQFGLQPEPDAPDPDPEPGVVHPHETAAKEMDEHEA
jgi:NhaP-type Na+/H+ or K+/H+ antiporter